MKKAFFWYGNHNSFSAIEDYVLKLKTWSIKNLIQTETSSYLCDGFDIYIFLECFEDQTIVDQILKLRERNLKSSFICICTEPIENNSFHHYGDLGTIVSLANQNRDEIEKILSGKIMPNKFKNLLLKSKKSDFKKFEKLINTIKIADTCSMDARFKGLIKASKFFDIFLVQKGIKLKNYEELFRVKCLKMNEFFNPPDSKKIKELISFKAVISGDINPYREMMLGLMGLETIRCIETLGDIKKHLENSCCISSYLNPNFSRADILKQVVCTLDFPKNPKSQIFSWQKAAFSISCQVPFICYGGLVEDYDKQIVDSFSCVKKMTSFVAGLSREASVELGYERLKKASHIYSKEKFSEWLETNIL